MTDDQSSPPEVPEAKAPEAATGVTVCRAAR